MQIVERDQVHTFNKHMNTESWSTIIKGVLKVKKMNIFDKLCL